MGKAVDKLVERKKIKNSHMVSVLGAVLFSLFVNSSAHAIDEKQAQKTYKKCAACHEIGEGAKNKVGPHLNGLEGRYAGSLDGYKFSNSMQHAGRDQQLEWNFDTLSKYLLKPRDMIKGSRMSFAGLKKQDERENLVKWMLAFDSEGVTHFEQKTQVSKEQLLGASAATLEGDAEYGEYLSGECVTCHQISGAADGIPSIIGWPKEYFIHAMYGYKTEVRENPVMRTVAKRLGDEELAALAAYFGSL